MCTFLLLQPAVSIWGFSEKERQLGPLHAWSFRFYWHPLVQRAYNNNIERSWVLCSVSSLSVYSFTMNESYITKISKRALQQNRCRLRITRNVCSFVNLRINWILIVIHGIDIFLLPSQPLGLPSCSTPSLKLKPYGARRTGGASILCDSYVLRP